MAGAVQSIRGHSESVLESAFPTQWLDQTLQGPFKWNESLYAFLSMFRLGGQPPDPWDMRQEKAGRVLDLVRTVCPSFCGWTARKWSACPWCVHRVTGSERTSHTPEECLGWSAKPASPPPELVLRCPPNYKSNVSLLRFLFRIQEKHGFIFFSKLHH